MNRIITINAIISRSVFIIILCFTLRSNANEMQNNTDYSIYENDKNLEMVIQRGHSSEIFEIEITPDREYFITRSDDEIKIWDKNSTLIKSLYEQNVRNIKINPDGTSFIGVYNNRLLKTWSIDGILEKEIIINDSEENYIKTVVFSPDGNNIAFSNSDKVITIINLDGDIIKRIIVEDYDNNFIIEYSRDGKYIACGSGSTLILWDIKSGKIDRVFKIPAEVDVSVDTDIRRISNIKFSPDGVHLIASYDVDLSDERYRGIVILWNINTNKFIKLYDKIHPAYINTLAISKSGRFAASGCDYGAVIFWDLLKGTEIKNYYAGYRIHVNNIVFTPDENQIISVNSDGIFRLLNTNDGSVTPIEKKFNSFLNLAIGKQKDIIATGFNDNSIKIWTLSNPSMITVINSSMDNIHSLKSNSLFFSSDDTLLASLIDGDQVNIYNTDDWSINKKFPECSGIHGLQTYTDSHGKFGSFDFIDGFGIGDIQFSKDKKYLVKNEDYYFSKLRTTAKYNLKKWILNEKDKHCIDILQEEIISFAIHPDSNNVAVASRDKPIRIINLDNNEIIQTLGDASINSNSVKYVNDGSYLLSGTKNSIIFWNKDGTSEKIIKAHTDNINSIDVSNDSKYILSGSDDKTVKLWNIKGKLLKTFSGNKKYVKKVFFNSDASKAISLTSDNEIIIWNISNDNYITMLSNNSEYLIYTPDGYWDGSRNAGNLVTMVKGLTSWGIDQFAIRNNRPDIILKRMEIGTPDLINHYLSQYKKRLMKLEKAYNIKESDLSDELHVPTAKIIDEKQDGKYLTITFKLIDSKFNLSAYNIYINDVPLWGSYGKSIAGNNKKITENIELISGKNKIEITCLNEKGTESYRALTYADYNKIVKGDLYFLGFGVSKYKNNKLDLSYADKDVRDLAKLYSKMKGKAFKNVYTKTFINKEVTPENINNSKSFLKNAKVDDTFVLFISGHGMYDKDNTANYYYIIHDTDISNLELTAVNFEYMEALLQGIPPRNKLFLMDTCESGEMDESSSSRYLEDAKLKGIKARTIRNSESNQTIIDKQPKRTYLYERDRYIYNDIFRRSGAIVFSSSKGGEYSYESDQINNGYFTKEIINALSSKTADLNNDGIVSTDELRDYVSREVPRKTDDLQHPVVDRDNLYQKFGFPRVK